MNNNYKIEVPYYKAGLNNNDLHPELKAYTISISKEIGLKKRPAVIICPGGGYEYLSDREAEPIAFRFAAFGINAFVLNYSICTQFPAALLELAKAVSFVRENSEQWDIDPNKIAVCGFSAGGHLAASLGVHWNKSFVKDVFCFKDEHKPNGMLLAYPVITSGIYRHDGSIMSLTRENSSNDILNLISLENHVSSDTPKAFIWHCADDGCVPPENSLDFMKALSREKIPFEGHIYPYGGHGLALCDDLTAGYEGHINTVCADWSRLAINWLKREL